MSQPTARVAPSGFRTVAELLHRLGDISPDRVRLQPEPGTATELDVIAVEARENRLCELVDGILVEKTTGFDESLIAAEIIALLKEFVKRHALGLVTAPDGMIRLMPGQVRIPDVAFFSRANLPRKRGRRPAIPDYTPDLAIEILSRGNTRREMDRKVREYLDAGARLVWLIDPRKRTARAYISPKEMVKLVEGQALDGGEVLPGFTLPLATLFACLDEGQDR